MSLETLLGSRDVINHVIIRPAICGFLQGSIETVSLFRTIVQILSLRVLGIITLTFWLRDVIGHVIIGLAIYGFL